MNRTALTKRFQKLKKKLVSQPLLVLGMGAVLGGLIVSAVHCMRSSHGPWLGFAYSNKEFNGPALLQSAKKVDFNWESGAPAKGIPIDGFAMKWVTCLKLESPANVWFSIHSDDGGRLFVDDELVVGDWDKPSFDTLEKVVSLKAGVHPIRAEYYENNGGASFIVELRQHDAQGPDLATSLLNFPGWLTNDANACTYVK